MKGMLCSVPVTISDNLFQALQCIGKDCKYQPATILNIMLSELFAGMYEEPAPSGRQGKRINRKSVHIPAVLNIMGNANDILCKTACITNISLGGFGIELPNGNSLFAEAARRASFFEVTAQLEPGGPPSTFICRNCYVISKSRLKIGGALREPDMLAYKAFLRAFIRAERVFAV